jgi:anaerobic magnesium-protoporphyrin IX monomethyl ester cyclase
MLLFPPHWTPTMPHLALPALTAYLRAQGVEVIQRDLNVEVFDRVLTQDYVESAIQRLRDVRRSSQHTSHVPQQTIRWALADGPHLAAQVEDAKNTFRGQAFYDGEASLQAFEVIGQSLAIASLPFYPAGLELGRYVPAAAVDSSRTLLRAVRDPRHNMFIELYRRSILPDIQREAPDLVGISFSTMDQMLAGMTLAHQIKEAGLACHVTVGGPHITMLREQLPRVPQLYDLIDSAIAFSGQVPLLRLVEALDGGADLSAVPNLIYRDGDQVRANPVGKPLSMEALPTPDFHGLPLDRYLTPRPVLPLLTARGCYYGKCAFCNQGYGGEEPFSQLSAGRVVEQMLALRDEYGARHIFFADEAITPRNLREMSSRLEELGAPVEWITCVRFEKTLSQALLERMARAGCRMLLFGLEAASGSTMRAIDKGIRVAEVERILRQSAEAGIWNHLFFFFGFPGETIEDAQETIDLIYRHKQHSHSAAPGTFLLERYAPAHLHPRRYGITQIADPPDKDLSIYFDYRVNAGMDEALADFAMSRFLETLPRKRYGQYYVHDTYRFLYASYLREQGKPLPPWLIPET